LFLTNCVPPPPAQHADARRKGTGRRRVADPLHLLLEDVEGVRANDNTIIIITVILDFGSTSVPNETPEVR